MSNPCRVIQLRTFLPSATLPLERNGKRTLFHLDSGGLTETLTFFFRIRLVDTRLGGSSPVVVVNRRLDKTVHSGFQLGNRISLGKDTFFIRGVYLRFI